MMHLVREYSTLLEKEGLLLNILKTHLAPTHSFADDIIKNNLQNEFRGWIYSFVKEEDRDLVKTDKTPFELMEMAGYDLFECKTEEDIQSFKKYYKDSELICTIYNGNRLNRCHVFFAVKKNVDEIKRSNFRNPQRQDLYGTSVISIQFARGSVNTLSIKNRYNHSVSNPDATFSNNLDNIIPGLTYSFKKYYGFNIVQSAEDTTEYLFNTLNCVKGSDNKYYRYNLEIDGMYYCENNIVLGYTGIIEEFSKNKERYLIIDQYIFDLKSKLIYQFVNCYDSFIGSITGVGEIKNIEVLKDGENKRVIIHYDNDRKVEILVDQNNAIKGYINNYITSIGNGFLSYNKMLDSIQVDNVVSIGNGFLQNNLALRKINLPNVKNIGSNFLYRNVQIDDVNLPNVQIIDENLMACNRALTRLSLPNVKYIGRNILCNNVLIRNIDAPSSAYFEDRFSFEEENLDIDYGKTW